MNDFPAKIAFRVEGNSQIGLGHLMRCIALAQGLNKVGAACFLVVGKQTAGLSALDIYRHNVILLPETDSVTEELRFLATQQQRLAFDALVLDGYQFDSRYRQRLKAIASQLIVFDDNNDSGQLYADLVINGASGAEDLNYAATAPGAVLCLGENYRLLRQEFLQPPRAFEQRQYLTLVMGGADNANLTLRMVNALNKRKFSGKLQVITGEAYPHIIELKAFLDQCELDYVHQHPCQQMAKAFNQSRLVLSAAGGSQFELLACACPSLLLVVADNQHSATEAASREGWCICLDARENKQGDCDKLAEQAIALWHNAEALTAMHAKALQFSHTQGAQNLLNQVQALICRD